MSQVECFSLGNACHHAAFITQWCSCLFGISCLYSALNMLSLRSFVRSLPRQCISFKAFTKICTVRCYSRISIFCIRLRYIVCICVCVFLLPRTLVLDVCIGFSQWLWAYLYVGIRLDSESFNVLFILCIFYVQLLRQM